MKVPNLILASSSSARLRLLQTVGINPIVMPSNFDESTVKLTDPKKLVEILAPVSYTHLTLPTRTRV